MSTVHGEECGLEVLTYSTPDGQRIQITALSFELYEQVGPEEARKLADLLNKAAEICERSNPNAPDEP